jgi:biotin carboxylase
MVNPAPSVIALMSPASYRGEAFAASADRIGIDLVRAIDLPAPLAPGDGLWLDFADPDAAVSRVVRFARERPVAAILAIDDRGAEIAARASGALGLAHNDPDAALAARDKFIMRQRLDAGGVPVPAYRRFPATTDAATISDEVPYPCVVKPLLLSGSRGVIRADTPGEFAAAFARTRAIIEASGMPAADHFILVERFVPGFEVALEGLLTNGALQTLALFDKPDPLDGPFFEETIYVTPSRLPGEVQAAISARTAEAATAIGVRHGPVHAELRVDLDTGEIWLVELAGRSIGGLCSSVLEFGAGMSLEDLILSHAAGRPVASMDRHGDAAGVMMIPIPARGMFRGVDGVREAESVPGVTGVTITAPCNQPILPLPEGESYLGFIFARGETAADAEQALRDAHARLRIRIEPMITLQRV